MLRLAVDNPECQHWAFIIDLASKREKLKDSEQETRLAKEDGKSIGIFSNNTKILL